MKLQRVGGLASERGVIIRGGARRGDASCPASRWAAESQVPGHGKQATCRLPRGVREVLAAS